MLSSLGGNNNNSYYDDNNLLLSLPAALQAVGSNILEANENLIPLTTQNYSEKYKDLERILADEKKTNEEFKKYYKALKVDHNRLKNECIELKTQMTSLIEDNKTMQERFKSMFERMQQELKRKQLLIEELKSKELDEIKLEKIRDELIQEIEAPYKDLVKQLQQELQKVQQECHKIRYESNYLKSVNEHDKGEHNNYIDQLKMKHDAELNAIRQDRDVLRMKIQECNQADIVKIKEVLKENNQLKIRLNALVEENEELREKIEHIDSQNNSHVRNHSKILSDYTTKISILESEKESLKQQGENAHKETMNLNEQLSEQLRKLRDSERENTKLKLSFDEIQHNCKRDLANLKLEMVKERGEQQRVREALNNQIDELKLKIEMANNSVELQKKMLEEKERELAKTMNSINEENWTRITELTNEKLELESKIQLMNKDFEFKLGSLQHEKDKSDDRLKDAERQREDKFKENSRLKTILAEAENWQSLLEKEQEKTRELSSKLRQAETMLNTNTNLEQELTEINMKLKSELSIYAQEKQRAKEQMSRLKEDYEERFNEWKSKFMAEKNDSQFKCDELQAKLNRTNLSLSDIKKYHEKKKKQYQIYAKALKQKAEALNGKVKELKMKERALKQMVPLEAFNKLKNHLRIIIKKHQEFRDIFFKNGNFVPGSELHAQLTSNPVALAQPALQISMPNLNLEESEKFLKEMKQSLIKDSKIINDTKLGEEDKEFKNLNFDKLSDRIDAMAAAQNERLKTSKSPAESFVRAKSSSQLFNYKTNNDLKKEENNLNNSENDLLSKHIELRKIPLSSSSSSSSFDSLVADRKLNKSKNNKKTDNENKKANKSQDHLKNFSMIKKETEQSDEFIQTDDDFPVSIKSDNSDVSK